MTQPPKVLLVDDEPDTLRLVHRVLQADGFHVIEAKDGREALALYRQEQPDLILLDIIIPHIDGMRVLRQIREQDSSTGIIMVSALNSERVTIECMQAGADDYVSKPFPSKKRAAASSRFLRRRSYVVRMPICRGNWTISMRRWLPLSAITCLTKWQSGY